MERILTSQEMKKADNQTIQGFLVPSSTLMERAALSCVSYIIEVAPFDSNIVIVASSGNNGGDGFAIARILHTRGYNSSIVFLGDEKKMSPETKLQYDICVKYGININSDIGLISKGDILVDAIFGIGLCRDIEGKYLDAINAFNESDALFKFAVDIPSGIDANTGRVLNTACICHRTITFNYKKPGHVLYPGKSYCGFVEVCDIGIGEESLVDLGENLFSYDLNDLELIPSRKADSHKGTYGKVLIIAGNETYAGACYLSASAALKTGSGLVKIFTHINNKNYILDKLPEAIIETYDSDYDAVKLHQAILWADAIAIGPGLGTIEVSRTLVSQVLAEATCPVLIDADGLNCISMDLDLLKNHNQEIVITPHFGEMSRLSGMDINRISDDVLSAAYEFASDYKLICLLKSASTVVSDGKENKYINTSGNSGMSTAGSGDVLSGIIASLIGQGMSSFEAAALGAYIHGLAGDVAANKLGEHSMLASDIINNISSVIRGDFDGR